MARVARGLPTIIAATVGRIIARWSLQEAMLRTILASAAGVHGKIGRVAALEPRIESFGEVVSDLLALQGIQVRTNLKALADRLNKAKGRRDLLANGVWVRHAQSRRLGVQEARFVPIDRQYLVRTRRMIEEGIRASYLLNREIVAAHRSSRQQFVQQALQGYRRKQQAAGRNTQRFQRRARRMLDAVRG
jgi:hypothetical protein